MITVHDMEIIQLVSYRGVVEIAENTRKSYKKVAKMIAESYSALKR